MEHGKTSALYQDHDWFLENSHLTILISNQCLSPFTKDIRVGMDLAMTLIFSAASQRADNQ